MNECVNARVEVKWFFEGSWRRVSSLTQLTSGPGAEEANEFLKSNFDAAVLSAVLPEETHKAVGEEKATSVRKFKEAEETDCTKASL